jgi:Protein of unknown function (DUF2867)
MLQASPLIRPVPSLMPHPALPQADWGDAFATETTAANARAALEHMLRQAGGWPTALLALRNRLAALAGLKPATFTLGGETGFPVISETPDEIVLGFNDSHLDFRILVTLLPTAPRQMRVATLVDRHGWAGRAYIGLIGPAHKRIVRRLMTRQMEI